MGAVIWLSARTRGEVRRLMGSRSGSGPSAWDELPGRRRDGYRNRLYRLNWLFAVLALALVVSGAFQAATVLRELRSGLGPPVVITHQHRSTARGRLLWEARFTGVVVAAVTAEGYVLVRQTQGEFAAFRVLAPAGEVIWEHRVEAGAVLPAAAIASHAGVTVVRLEDDRVHHFVLPPDSPLIEGPPPETFVLPSTRDAANGGYQLRISNAPGAGGGAARVWLYWCDYWCDDETLVQ